MKYNLGIGFLAYERIGEGIPLLFIHGYPLSRKIWLDQQNNIPEVAEFISVDLRGHGESYPYNGPYPMDLLADDCKHLLDSLNLKSPFVVCGLSMGGYVAFALQRKYPAWIKGMILTSTRSGPDSPEGKAGREATIKNVLQHGVEFIVDTMLPKLVSTYTVSSNPKLLNSIREIMLETSVNGIVGALQGMRDRPDSTPLLPLIKCPVLIVHGEDDQLISIKEAETMRELIPGSRLVTISNAGHLPCMEQPEQFNRAIREFMLSLS